MARIRKSGRHQNAWKHCCFRAFFVLLKGFSSVASRDEESEKHCLENTVWKVLVRNGVPRKVPKKVLRVPRLRRGSIGDGTRSTFFGTFLGTPFRTGTFQSTFSALFLARASALLWMATRIVIEGKRSQVSPGFPQKSTLNVTSQILLWQQCGHFQWVFWIAVAPFRPPHGTRSETDPTQIKEHQQSNGHWRFKIATWE